MSENTHAPKQTQAIDSSRKQIVTALTSASNRPIHPVILLQQAMASPSRLSVEALLQIHRMIGNQAVQRMLDGQTGLNMGIEQQVKAGEEPVSFQPLQRKIGVMATGDDKLTGDLVGIADKPKTYRDNRSDTSPSIFRVHLGLGGVIQRNWEKVDGDKNVLKWSKFRGGLQWYYRNSDNKMSFQIVDQSVIPQKWLERYRQFEKQWQEEDWWQKNVEWGPIINREPDKFPGDTAYVGRIWVHATLDEYYHQVVEPKGGREEDSDDSDSESDEDPPEAYSWHESHNPQTSYYFDINENGRPDIAADFTRVDLSKVTGLGGRFKKLIIENVGNILNKELTYQNAVYLLSSEGKLEIISGNQEILTKNQGLINKYFKIESIKPCEEPIEYSQEFLKKIGRLNVLKWSHDKLQKNHLILTDKNTLIEITTYFKLTASKKNK